MKVCTRAEEVKKLEDTISITTNCVEIRLLFLTDSIVRIRAGFDGTFAEESYSLVMTAWDDRMDGLMNRFRRRVRPAETVFTDGEKEAVIEGRKLRVVVEKEPFRICIMIRKERLSMPISWNWGIRRIPTTEEFTPAKSHRTTAFTDLARRAGSGTRRRNSYV